MSLKNSLDPPKRLPKHQLIAIMTAVLLNKWEERVETSYAIVHACDEALEIEQYVRERLG